MSEQTETEHGWLSEDEIEIARERMPVIYVEAVPVRIDESGRVTHVGLLLRAMPDGTISRAIVSGRVLWGERVRDALVRHIEKDLGPLALPKVPVSPTPFTIAEYFPDPSVSGFHDPRQHAVSLVYLVPIEGICEPSQESLEITWITPNEAVSPEVRAEMTSGHDRLVRRALAHAGQLP
ncbi:MAG: ADP-ribose pyrophosphatase YjhB (NUDIX family) [Acidimicrobiales bacterium]